MMDTLGLREVFSISDPIHKQVSFYIHSTNMMSTGFADLILSIINSM